MMPVKKLSLASLLLFTHMVNAEQAATLSLNDFISQATRNDTTFEAILLDQLPLQYRRDALLPDSDLILDVKYQHYFYLEQDRDNPAASVSLSKLFPFNGTQVSLSYNKSSSAFTTTDAASLELLIAQPIARNAFGKATRMQDQIIGIENQVTRYQVVEAYEDYLASLTSAYYNWYSAYENLRLGQASYRANQQLMENILDRQRQKIALPIDVNKMELSLIGKKENLLVLQETYDNISNLVFKSIRYQGEAKPVPVKPEPPAVKVQFAQDYQNFTDSSRTYRMLRLLEEQGTLEVKKAADDLLPSTNLLLGYQLEGEDWGIRNSEDSFFAGIQLSMPIGRTVSKARQQIAQVEYKKTVLSNQNKYEELHTNLKNLNLQIQREQNLVNIAQKKVKLAEAILKDEAENYSFGKVTLNDYIDAVNRLDENRFSYTDHTVKLNKLLVEWLRLTDQLVGENVLEQQPAVTQ